MGLRARPGGAASKMIHERNTLVNLSDAGSWSVKQVYDGMNMQYTAHINFPESETTWRCDISSQTDVRNKRFGTQCAKFHKAVSSICDIVAGVLGPHEVLTYWAPMQHPRSVAALCPATQACFPSPATLNSYTAIPASSLWG